MNHRDLDYFFLFFRVPGNWRQPENPNAKRVNDLLAAYSVIAGQEKIEKDRKKYLTATPKRRAFHPASASSVADAFRLGTASSTGSDKYGILSPASRRLKAISQGNSGNNETVQSVQEPFDVQMRALLTPATTVDRFEQLVPEEFFVNTNVNAGEMS